MKLYLCGRTFVKYVIPKLNEHWNVNLVQRKTKDDNFLVNGCEWQLPVHFYST